jgi:hypothetical protein
MKQGLRGLLAAWLLGMTAAANAVIEGLPPLTTATGERFAVLALDCIHREYPNKIAHQVQGPGEMAEPRALHPAFYGCFDWHSSVHGHWLLARLAHLDLLGIQRERAMAALDQTFTRANIDGELAYFAGVDRRSFERPYGLAWLLQLAAELHEWDDPQAKLWLETLQPLVDVAIANVMDWLPKLQYAVRSGTHDQTAFSFGLMLDYARRVGHKELTTALTDRSIAFYRGDILCPLAYEPSGADFLSPCLMQADLMRRLLPRAAYATWLAAFMPAIPRAVDTSWLPVGVVVDPTDGHLVHLDGLNLSRAWALASIADALPPADPRIAALRAAASVHAQSGLAAVSADHYAGSHWLASFAVYLVTARGAPAPP